MPLEGPAPNLENAPPTSGGGVPAVPPQGVAEPARGGIGPVRMPAPAARSRGLGDRILKAGGAVLVAHLCFKLCGIVQNNVIPNFFGAAASDVFIFAYGVVIQTAFNFGEQCMAPAVLPVFVQAREKEGEARAWRYASTIFNVQIIGLVLLTAIMIFAARPLTRALTQWDAAITLETAGGQTIRGEAVRIEKNAYVLSVDGTELSVPFSELKRPPSVGEVAAQRRDLEQKLERGTLAARFLPWMAPGLIGMSLASLTYVLLNAYKEFFWAAFGDSVLKLCIVLGAILGAMLSRAAQGTYADWRYLVLGAVAGGTLKLGTHLAALKWKRARMYRFTLNLRDPYIREFALLALPLLAGILISSMRDVVVNNVLTTQELLPTYFAQGKRVIDTISFLVPYTLSIALLPYFCDLSAQGNNAQLGALLTRTIRMLIWFFVPVGIVLAVAAFPTCYVLYSGKLIDAEKAHHSALVMQCYSLQLPFAALEIMVMQAFFSNRRMIAPTVAGFIFSILAAAAAYWLVVGNHMTGTVEILLTVGLCLVLTKVMKSVLLVGLLRSTVPVMPTGETLGFLARLAVAGGGAAIAAWGAGFVWRASELGAHLPGKRAAELMECVLIAAAGGAAYLLLSLLLLMPEPRECAHWTREKLRLRVREKGA